MKKTYFNPALINMGRLPVITSRRIFGASRTGQRVTSAYLKGSTEEDDDDDGTEEKLLMKRIMKSVRKELTDRASAEDVNNIVAQLSFLKPDKDGKGGFPIEALRSMADETNGVMSILTKQGLELQALRNAAKEGSEKDLSLRSQIKAYFEKNKEIIKQIRSGVQANIPEFEVNLNTRAANPMLPADVMPNGSLFISSSSVKPGINMDLRTQPNFWNFIPKGKTNSETYYWVNKLPTTGEAAWLAPGDYKPPIKFSFETELSKAKKIAVSAKAPLELFEDIDGFNSWVEKEIMYALDIKINSTLMDSTETSTVPSGIKQMSVPYNVLTGVETTNPNLWDAIIACVTQLRVMFFTGSIIAIVNPVDYTNAVILKAQNQGQLFIAPSVGATIIQDVNQPKGTINVIAIDYYNLLIYKALRIAWGWENDDFTRNMSTAIGETRLHVFENTAYAGFAIYDTLSNIKTAITAAP